MGQLWLELLCCCCCCLLWGALHRVRGLRRACRVQPAAARTTLCCTLLRRPCPALPAAGTAHLLLSCPTPQVVATYHGDHAYTFDITGAAPPPPSASARSPGAAATAAAAAPPDLFAAPAAAAALAAGALVRGRAGAGGGSGCASASSSMGDLPGMLPAAAERAKADGNLALFSKQLYEAVQHYSAAIRLAPWAPVLYTNRALALLQRGWGGDAVCALRDAETGARRPAAACAGWLAPAVACGCLPAGCGAVHAVQGSERMKGRSPAHTHTNTPSLLISSAWHLPSHLLRPQLCAWTHPAPRRTTGACRRCARRACCRCARARAAPQQGRACRPA